MRGKRKPPISLALRGEPFVLSDKIFPTIFLRPRDCVSATFRRLESQPKIAIMGARLNGRAPQNQQQQQQQSQSDPLKSEDDIPACQSCRRKKARCSREQPCSQCVRFDVQCIYDDRRLKPGLRAGVVDNLSRRIETLENMFLGQEILWKQMWETLHPGSRFPGVTTEEREGDKSARDEIRERQEELKRSLLQVAASRKDTSAGDEQVARPVKRQRVDISVASSPEQGLNGMSAAEIIESDLLGQLVEFYFQNIHHWIPILHVRRFRHQIQSPEGRESAIYILYALIAVCIRFVADPRIPDEDRKARVAEGCRQKVVLCSMESFSVENLQALVIIAFDTVRPGLSLPFRRLLIDRLRVDEAHRPGLLLGAWRGRSSSCNSVLKRTICTDETRRARL
jgi:hypothetical protein